MRTLSRRTWLKAAGLASISAPQIGSTSQIELPLNTKKIPSSGEAIPIIGIGTNRYGVGDDIEAMQPLKAVLETFAAAGRGVIDTAPMYRNSESVLGQLIKELGLADHFFIATKCDVEGGNVTRDQLASSEQKLHSGTLDLVAVHNLKHWREQLPVLQAAKQAKQIRYVGITTSRDRQYEEFKEVLASEKLDFMQINYSLADRDAQPLLELAAEKGVAVMINLPFGRGKLFDAVQGQELPDWAAEFDADSWGQFFLKYVVSHPAVTCAIPGTTKVRHMQDNLNAAQGRLPNAEQRKKMEQFYDSL